MITKITYTFNDVLPTADGNPQNEDNAVLFEQVRAATVKGNFALADALLAQSELEHDEVITTLTKQRCERISFRAGVASLASDHEKAISLYEQAAAICVHVDPEASLAYAKKASDAANEQSRYFPDPPVASPS